MISASTSLLADVGRGTLAGLAGTLVMTLAQRVEMRATGRPASTVPGQVGARLLGRRPSRRDEARLSEAVHWVHGVAGGALRGLVGQLEPRPGRATALHFAALWGSDAALYRALGIAPVPWHWSPSELAVDLGHKGIYAVATGATYARLGARRPRP